MADLSIDFCGIRSPNPFWLASAPPTNSGAQIHKAFEYGWGGAVWKTIGAPVLNVSNRYGAWHYNGLKMLAINNVELISDRPLELNLAEIADVKKHWADRAVIVSAMVECQQQAWVDIVRRIEDTGADGIEINCGCPHGMSERGMGSAVGQNPDLIEQISEWTTGISKIPIIIKLTPNITDINYPARAAVKGGAPAVSLINTINSIIGVDLDSFAITPNVGGKGGHGGYAGPAVKPIALNMLSSIAGLQELQAAGTKISGMGGISTWKDAAEFLLLGAHSLQVCTAVMHYGYRLIDDLCDGLSNWLDEKGYSSVNQIIGASVPRISQFQDFDLSYRAVAEINQDKCIQCNLCYVACNDTAHQCIDLYSSDGLQVQPYAYDIRDNGKLAATQNRAQPVVRESDCVGCALCANVCPVDNCITMVERPSGRESVTWREISTNLPEVTTDWAAMQRYRSEKGIEIH